MWDKIGTILQDRRPLNRSEPSLPIVMPEDTVLTLYDEEEPNKEELDPIATMSDEEFIKDYAAFLHAHYGRPPQYLTDLFCCMAPIMVEMCSDTGVHTLHRYWWLPINHPLVIRMDAMYEPNCGQVNAGFCGSFVIYADSIIVKWIEALWNLFVKELGKELEVAKKTEEEVKMQQAPPPPLRREEEPKTPPLIIEQPPVIRMAPATLISNKKGD